MISRVSKTCTRGRECAKGNECQLAKNKAGQLEVNPWRIGAECAFFERVADVAPTEAEKT